MATKQHFSEIFLILTGLLWVPFVSEAQLEPRFFPPGSTTIAAYYVPYLDITVAADLDTLVTVLSQPLNGPVDYDRALFHIRVLNNMDNNGNGYLGLNSWRLPKATDNDPGCTSVYTQLTGLPANGAGFYCTAGEMGHLYYTEGHGQKQVFPTNWPFTGTNLAPYWSSARGGRVVAPRPKPWETRLTFDLGNGWQIGLHEWTEAYVWPVTDGDPLALPAVRNLDPVLDFRSQDVNTTSAAKSVNIFNSGLAPLTIQSLNHSNPTEFPISFDLCSGKTLLPAQRCVLLVNFAPTRDGGYAATIEILSNAQSSPDSVSLVGTGGTPIQTVSPTQLDFGDVTVRTNSLVSQQITLVNGGNADFRVLSVASDNPRFFIHNNTCTSRTISPDGTGNHNSCVVQVKFHPEVLGATSGHIQIETDPPTSPISIALSGVGTEGVFELSSYSVDFAGQAIGTQSAPRTITITSTGTVSAVRLGDIEGVTVILPVSSDSDEFVISAQHCLTDLPPGASCTFDVLFLPRAAGPRGGKIHIRSNSQSSRDTLFLSGVGEAVALEVLVPNDLHFGEQPVGTTSAAKEVSLVNLGSVDINVASVIPDNSNYQIGNDLCTGETVVPNSGCTFDVSFHSTVAGAQAGHIVVSSDAPSTPNTVAVSGTGTVPELTVSPPQVSFPRQLVGTTAASMTFTLANTGKADLAVSTLIASLAEFPITSDACTAQTLPPGGTCTFVVSFEPSRDGGISGSIDILSNAPTSPDVALVSGTGLVMLADVLSPSQLHFDVQAVGTASSVQLVTMSNTGAGELPVSTITSDASEFTLVNDPCSGLSIPVGGTCVFEVQFSPTQTGAQSGHIVVVSAAGTSPDHIAVTGTGGEAMLSILPNHLSFGHQDLGTVSGPKTVTVTNSGNASLAIASLSSQNAAEFPLDSDACSGKSILPGHSCLFSVAFAPGRDGGTSGLITFDSDAPGSPHSLSVAGNGIGIVLDILAPNELHFATLTIGSFSGVRTVTLSNTGTADIDVGMVSSDSPNFFVINDTCSGQPIPPFGLCDFGVQFAPTQTGAVQGHIEVSSNAITAPDHVTVTGFGVESELLATPSHLDFGSRQIGSSEARTVILSNPGTTDISVSDVTVQTGVDFSIESDTCFGSTLVPGADCSFAVRFLPGRDGGASGVVEFDSDAATSPGSISLTGSGVGTAGGLLKPTELHFGSQPLATASAPKTVTLTNSGTADLNISSLSSDNPEFGIVSDTCSGQAIVPVGTCEFGLQFTPTQIGSQIGEIEITSDSSTSPDHVALTGIGVTSAVSLSPSHLTFGSLQIGNSSVPRTIVVTNTGGAALSVSGIDSSNSSEFSFSADTCSGQTVDPGNSCTFSVAFTPTAEGGRSTLIQITSDAPSSPDTLSAAGNGAGVAAESVMPASLVFPATFIMETAEPKNVFITNLGAVDLDIGSISVSLPIYSIFDDDCSGQTIAPQSSCTFGVLFTPLQGGVWDGQLEIQSNAPTSPEIVPVSGTGMSPPSPLADFLWNPLSPLVGEVVNFVDRSAGGPTQWDWDFGDGENSSQENPEHAFSADGDYVVTLTAANNQGSDHHSRTISVTEPLPAPTAVFSWTPTNPKPGDAVSFIDSSAGIPTSWNWSFGDGGASTAANPTHSFANSGSHTVVLWVANATGSDSITHHIVVQEDSSDPTAAFEVRDADGALYVPGSALARGQVYTFIDRSVAADGESLSEWSWDFGDGVTGNGATPEHSFDLDADQVTVSLEVIQSDGLNGSVSETFRLVESDGHLGDPEGLLLAAVARTPGIGGSFWQTRVTMTNPSKTTTIDLSGTLLVSGMDNSDAPSVVIAASILPGESVAIDDILGNTDLNPDDTARGALWLTPDPIPEDSLWPIVSGRIFTSDLGDPDAGTFGQNIPARLVRAHSGSAAGSPRFLEGLRADDEFRTNIGAVNVEPVAAAVMLELRSGTRGDLLAVRRLTMPARSHVQIPLRRSEFPGFDPDHSSVRNLWIVAKPEAGARVEVYASVVDNNTHDPSYVAGLEGGTNHQTVAGVASKPGSMDTVWRSDLNLLNPGQSDVSVDISFFFVRQGETRVVKRSQTLIAGRQEIFEDVLGDGLFGLDGPISGWIAVAVEDEGEVISSVRTYNKIALGSLGQWIPGEGNGLEIGGGIEVVDAWLTALRVDQDFRTNIGVIHSGGEGDVEVQLELLDHNGTVVAGPVTVTVPEGQWIQNSIAVFFALDEAVNFEGPLVVRGSSTSSGRAVIYASTVDNATGDPVFVTTVVP